MMKPIWAIAWVVAASLLGGGMARAQQEARLRTMPLVITEATAYRTPVVLEPIRRLDLAAPRAGVVGEVTVKPGDSVEAKQPIVQLDPTELDLEVQLAAARLKRARHQAETHKAEPGELGEAQAALAIAELHRKQADLLAPFAGRIFQVMVVPGQFVLAGQPLVTLADTSKLVADLPVERKSDQARAGQAIDLDVEGDTVQGKVQAILPLPSKYHRLLQLATPLADARVVVDNAGDPHPAGAVVRTAAVPSDAITQVPLTAVQSGAEGKIVQVIRQGMVHNVPVRGVGPIGADRVQVSGAFDAGDQLIIHSSIPLVEGTQVRFGVASAAPASAAPPTAAEPGQAAAAMPSPSSAPAAAKPRPRRPTAGRTPAPF